MPLYTKTSEAKLTENEKPVYFHFLFSRSAQSWSSAEQEKEVGTTSPHTRSKCATLFSAKFSHQEKHFSPNNNYF
jgi:hypothetical protein